MVVSPTKGRRLTQKIRCIIILTVLLGSNPETIIQHAPVTSKMETKLCPQSLRWLDVLVTSNGAEELPHQILRLNVPGTASRYVHQALRSGLEQPIFQRFHSCHSGLPHGQGRCLRLELDGCSETDFQDSVLNVELLQQRQHTNYAQLLQRFQTTATSFQRNITISFLRDPVEHFVRSFEKKTNHPDPLKRVFQFAASWKERGITNLSDSQVSLQLYTEEAFWRWNMFTRSLAGNFSSGYLVESLHSGVRNAPTKFDQITRPVAEHTNNIIRIGDTPLILAKVSATLPTRSLVSYSAITTF